MALVSIAEVCSCAGILVNWKERQTGSEGAHASRVRFAGSTSTTGSTRSASC